MAEWFERDPHELCRSFELDNGNIIDIQRNTRNGYWRIKYRKGATPLQLTGDYTLFGYAMAAVTRHLETTARQRQIVREITDAA